MPERKKEGRKERGKTGWLRAHLRRQTRLISPSLLAIDPFEPFFFTQIYRSLWLKPLSASSKLRNRKYSQFSYFNSSPQTMIARLLLLTLPPEFRSRPAFRSQLSSSPSTATSLSATSPHTSLYISGRGRPYSTLVQSPSRSSLFRSLRQKTRQLPSTPPPLSSESILTSSSSLFRA